MNATNVTKATNVKRDKKIKRHFSTLLASLLYVLSVGHPVLADDTEVLIGLGNQANILFIMDTSGSMAWSVNNQERPPAGESTRLEIVQTVFANLMRNPAYQGFNVALMRFDRGGSGGYFVTPMQELNANTQDSIIAASNAFSPGGNTPLSETLYEAARFWKGMSVNYGNSSNPSTNHPDVFTGSNYNSPINSQCQRNYTILLTDGEPNGDNEADDRIRTDLLGGTDCDGSGQGRCLDDIAGYLFTTDLNTDIDEDQTVETYTIGFTTNQPLLEATAMAGGGTANENGMGNDHYFTARTADELSDAFAEALAPITASNGNFTPPALAANAFNGISHYNKLFFALFEPAAKPKWNGNIKPYAINDNYDLVDAVGNDAVDDNGVFLEGSRSFWSNDADGGSIVAGGANGQLPSAANRNLYTYTGGYDVAGLVPDDPDISANNNALKNVISSDLTADMLGITGASAAAIDAEFASVLDTVRNNPLGAPLHSQPALVTYGRTEADPDLTLFVATNDGFLHAFNASTGIEQFAFIPQELLSNLPILTRNSGAHIYGLDGDISVWVKESNDAGRSIDHVFVYVGMRRGGSNYYALDATNLDAPTLKWVTYASTYAGLAGVIIALMFIYLSGAVLIFGGGYDTAQDANPLDTDDSIGRAIFIVDADTGEKLWQAGHAEFNPDLVIPEMTNSIPSELRLLDSNLDGKTDRLYVGDMRGQIFRIDLNATLTDSTAVLLANLGSNTEADNRRFYYPPDVVVTQRPGSAPYISINIGSGYRAHPLNPLNADGTPADRVDDRFYSLRDPHVLGTAPGDFTTITTGNLFDATSSLVTSTGDIDSLAAANGWYITLGTGNGEKVLAPSLTINGEIFFTTYTPPESVAISDCSPPSGSGRLYRISLFDANPVINDSNAGDGTGDGTGGEPGGGTPTTDDRGTDLNRPGIPSGVTALFRENGDGNVELLACQGTECDSLPDAIQIQETYWTDEN